MILSIITTIPVKLIMKSIDVFTVTMTSRWSPLTWKSVSYVIDNDEMTMKSLWSIAYAR